LMPLTASTRLTPSQTNPHPGQEFGSADIRQVSHILKLAIIIF
jgi:hypothetical protein